MFEIWSGQSGNRLGEFETKEEAFGLVRELADDYGADWAQGLLLGKVDDQGQPERVTDGPALLEQAGARSLTLPL